MGFAASGADGITIGFLFSIVLLFGLDIINLAFNCYLQIQIFNWAFVPGGQS